MVILACRLLTVNTLKSSRVYERLTGLWYNWHRKLDDLTELFFYESYKDREAWESKHMTKSYVKELGEVLPNYIVGDIEMSEYELAESA